MIQSPAPFYYAAREAAYYAALDAAQAGASKADIQRAATAAAQAVVKNARDEVKQSINNFLWRHNLPASESNVVWSAMATAVQPPGAALSPTAAAFSPTAAALSPRAGLSPTAARALSRKASASRLLFT